MTTRPIIFTPIALRATRCAELLEISAVELRLVVALIAAVKAGRLGATREELVQLTGLHSNFNMGSLERRLWVKRVARIPKRPGAVYGPSPRAAQRLGLGEWQSILFADEELARVDPNVPGFLLPLEAAS